ncbi:cystine transport system permease protein [Pullulanibacillus pueri]|uniref:Cysteine ABC transporter permease n=1 Tax=Pullulanibacillus pueri TaxID=1437324 RepID=A0A8J2ZRH8_9BACL|nr:amino acid ABC transporter permease [Pullulanibacillus pueri]MBM7679990.1 cystine transport system permease protein [Pullulanibacillus pueri]GGH73820.1 cysteine ABC transporter permease [Pullulanibacillus pueri]
MDDRSARLYHIFVESFLPLLKAGVEFTIPLTLVSFFFGLLLAFLTALVRLSPVTPLKLIARFYVWIFRGTPLIVQLFIIFFGLPSIGLTLSPFLAASIGFSLSVGAYGSEIIRAAIISIPQGQWEAAYSIGMTKNQALRRIIIPQALKVSVPPLSNSFISLIKDTSLAASITVTEMFQKAQQITARYYEPMLLYCEVAVIYLIFSTVLSSLQNRLERHFDLHSSNKGSRL